MILENYTTSEYADFRKEFKFGISITNKHVKYASIKKI